MAAIYFAYNNISAVSQLVKYDLQIACVHTWVPNMISFSERCSILGLRISSHYITSQLKKVWELYWQFRSHRSHNIKQSSNRKSKIVLITSFTKSLLIDIKLARHKVLMGKILIAIAFRKGALRKQIRNITFETEPKKVRC